MSINGLLSSSIRLDDRLRSRWVGRVLRGFALTYLVIAAVALTIVEANRGSAPSATCTAIANWIALPMQCIAVIVTMTLAWRSRRSVGAERVTWRLVAAFCVQNLFACYVWVSWRTQATVARFGFADVSYLVDYWVLALVYGWLFVKNGGRFAQPRIWMDAIAILATLLTVFWMFLLGAMAQPAGAQGANLLLFLPYTLTLVLMMTMAALLWMQLADFRSRPVEVLLIVAGLSEAVFEIIWLAGWRHNIDFAGAFYNFGDVICFSAVISASTCAGASRARENGMSPSPHGAHTFLPTLAALLSLALVAGTLASTRASNAWILVSLVVVSAMLLVTRHRAAMQEITSLNHALAMHAADARLTELARQSADLLLVVDRAGRITYASPAAQAIVGTRPELLADENLTRLFGVGHEPALAAFVVELAARPDAHASIEVSLAAAGEAIRVLRFSGANRLDNPHIRGVTVTVTDISEQRFLERAVLDAANQERLRLASDIHDGLGQELTGISMLLQSAANSPDPDPERQSAFLTTIVGHMRKAIRGSRDLAHGLSPIYVVRGSLSEALQNLYHPQDGGRSIDVQIERGYHDAMVDEFAADHLYRIAREAVYNALTHSDCKMVEVKLRVVGDELHLRIADDGRGMNQSRATEPTLGLKLMRYRARIIGGALTIEPGSGVGTVVEVTAPVRDIAREQTRESVRMTAG